ncbi:hypothetical protein BDP81DRAFT_22621 [Colletotrichum phormii]|uniref:Uncharacterized protein n=1 Tax=Colletotrichum phormii TaxID=359342 RepID=A0AAI9ZRA9_9PEZI|nr:uncharacterized protein BDP81DRAFT_22621 [Colletotrichum phormii]KAK1636426.1 hypothetical protein BDP81DRAFT_22621 [Colletotrichum phormii]
MQPSCGCTLSGEAPFHMHMRPLSHILITEAECNCNFTGSLQTAWGIWGRTIANCKISGSKTKLVRKRTCLAIACGTSENVDGVKISTVIMSGVRRRVPNHRFIASGHAARGLGWRTGSCRRPNRLSVCESMDFAFYEAVAIGTEFTTGPVLDEGLSCGHTARARGG